MTRPAGQRRNDQRTRPDLEPLVLNDFVRMNTEPSERVSLKCVPLGYDEPVDADPCVPDKVEPRQGVEQPVIIDVTSVGREHSDRLGRVDQTRKTNVRQVSICSDIGRHEGIGHVDDQAVIRTYDCARGRSERDRRRSMPPLLTPLPMGRARHSPLRESSDVSRHPSLLVLGDPPSRSRERPPKGANVVRNKPEASERCAEVGRLQESYPAGPAADGWLGAIAATEGIEGTDGNRLGRITNQPGPQRWHGHTRFASSWSWKLSIQTVTLVKTVSA